MLPASSGAQAGEVTPIFQRQYTEAGGAIGRIVLDDPATYYVTVNALVPRASAQTFNLTFDKRAIIDLGTIASGDSASATNNPLGGTTTTGYVLFRSDLGAPATITVHSHGVPLDTRFTLVNADETAAGAAINSSITGNDTTTMMPFKGWTAFTVTGTTTPPTTQQYDVSPSRSHNRSRTPSRRRRRRYANICGTPGAVNIAFHGKRQGQRAGE